MRTAAMAALLLGAVAQAQERAHHYYTIAPVVAVSPVVQESTTRVPEEHCTQGTPRPARPLREVVHTAHCDDPSHNDAPTRLSGIVGGVIGGLIGHQFGGGHGRTALTLAGAIAGAAIGRGVSRHHVHDAYSPATQAVAVLQCETRYRDEQTTRTIGYDVTYRYRGRDFTKRTEHDPGDSIRIGVTVSPAT
jgi:uncharacterized protein YcfJ